MLLLKGAVTPCLILIIAIMLRMLESADKAKST
jgi:hypothetical protein